MKKPMVKLFPIILIVLDFGAAVAYLCYEDYRMFTYWMAAMSLTICVTI